MVEKTNSLFNGGSGTVEGVEEIDGAFTHCSVLEKIPLPSSCTTIGDYAFSNCTNLQSVTLGKNLTSIGDFAFSNCTLLAEVINRSTLNIVAGESTYGKVALYAESVIKQK